jgi:hypothetical protein
MKKVFTLLCPVLLASLVGISCKQKSTASTPSTHGTTGVSAPVVTTITLTPQVNYNLSGTSYTYTSNGTTIMDSSGSVATSPGSKIYRASIYNTKNQMVCLKISRGTLWFTGSSPDTTIFKNYFSVETLPYSNNATNGVEVSMTDTTGSAWSTSKGLQTGSTFSITAVKEQWSVGMQYVKFVANFSCKLYDINGQNQKTLTNGVFVGFFGNI